MKKTFRILTILSALLFLLVGCSSNSDTKETAQESKEVTTKQVIKVGMDGETPPYSTVNDKGEVVGFEVDVWNEIGKRIGYEIKFERMEFSTLFGLLDDGRLDTIANVISVTPEREKIYNFGSSYQYEKVVLISKPDKEISSVKDLNGMTIAVEPTTSDVLIVDTFEKENGIKMERVFYDGFSIQDVVLGRVDLWIKGETGAAEVIEQIGSDKLKVLVDTQVFFESAYPFAKTESGNKLRELSNKALKEMREDGTLTKISKKYFDIDVTQK